MLQESRIYGVGSAAGRARGGGRLTALTQGGKHPGRMRRPPCSAHRTTHIARSSRDLGAHASLFRVQTVIKLKNSSQKSPFDVSFIKFII